MTEVEWLACVNPQRMLEYLRAGASVRKLKHLWVSMGETAPFGPNSFWNEQADFIWGECGTIESAEQVRQIRCIFGNPFRDIPGDPIWLTSTVCGLARGIYAERAFDRLPILADALQDAGCDNPDILTHCRGDGPHVRGCCELDLVLEKA